MSCHYRNVRVVLVHVHIEESDLCLEVRGEGEPEESWRVLLDLIKMFGYSINTRRHRLVRPRRNGCLNRDLVSHHHPCPSDSSFMVRSSQLCKSPTMCRQPDRGRRDHAPKEGH